MHARRQPSLWRGWTSLVAMLMLALTMRPRKIDIRTSAKTHSCLIYSGTPFSGASAGRTQRLRKSSETHPEVCDTCLYATLHASNTHCVHAVHIMAGVRACMYIYIAAYTCTHTYINWHWNKKTHTHIYRFERPQQMVEARASADRNFLWSGDGAHVDSSRSLDQIVQLHVWAWGSRWVGG